MTICCVVVPSERVPLSSGRASTNFATLLPESGVCGVVTDGELFGVTSSAALSQPALALTANAAAAIALAEIEKLDRLMIDSFSDGKRVVRERRIQSSERGAIRRKEIFSGSNQVAEVCGRGPTERRRRKNRRARVNEVTNASAKRTAIARSAGGRPAVVAMAQPEVIGDGQT